MSRLVLETAIGPVLALLLGKLRAARWDSAGATAEGTQDPAPDRAAGQGLATTRWRDCAQRNIGEPGLTLAAARILGRPADPAGHPDGHRVGAQASGMILKWLSFRCRLAADAANPCGPGPERPAPQGHAPPGSGCLRAPAPGPGARARSADLRPGSGPRSGARSAAGR